MVQKPSQSPSVEVHPEESTMEDTSLPEFSDNTEQHTEENEEDQHPQQSSAQEESAEEDDGIGWLTPS